MSYVFLWPCPAHIPYRDQTLTEASLWWWCHSVQPAGASCYLSQALLLPLALFSHPQALRPSSKNPREVSKWLCQCLADKCQPRLQHLSCTQITVLFQHCRLPCCCFSSSWLVFLHCIFLPLLIVEPGSQAGHAWGGWLLLWGVPVVRKNPVPKSLSALLPPKDSPSEATSWQTELAGGSPGEEGRLPGLHHFVERHLCICWPLLFWCRGEESSNYSLPFQQHWNPWHTGPRVGLGRRVTQFQVSNVFSNAAYWCNKLDKWWWAENEY